MWAIYKDTYKPANARIKSDKLQKTRSNIGLLRCACNIIKRWGGQISSNMAHIFNVRRKYMYVEESEKELYDFWELHYVPSRNVAFLEEDYSMQMLYSKESLSALYELILIVYTMSKNVSLITTCLLRSPHPRIMDF